MMRWLLRSASRYEARLLLPSRFDLMYCFAGLHHVRPDALGPAFFVEERRHFGGVSCWSPALWQIAACGPR